MSESLREGWEWAKLGEVADWGSGGTPKKSEPDYYGGKIPWVLSGDLEDSEIRAVAQTISESGLANSSAKMVEPGAVLIAMYGATIGKLAIVREPVACNQAIAFAHAGIDERFLFYFLMKERNRFRSAGKGAAQKNISQTILKSWPIPVAPLEEQERIVVAIEEHLSRLDAAEASLDAADRRLDALLQSALASASSGPWPTPPLSSLVRSLKNGVFVSRPGIDPPGHPIFRISAVRPLKLRVDDIRYANPIPKKAESYLVDAGDLLFTRYSGNPDYVGAAAVVPPAGAGVLHPDKLIRVVADETKVLPGWIAAYVAAGTGRREIERRLKTTAGQVGISGAQLKTVPIATPPLEYQREAMHRLQNVIDERDCVRNELNVASASARALRRSILSAAFSGKLVPQDPTDEPASSLLDRIAAERPAKKTRKKKAV